MSPAGADSDHHGVPVVAIAHLGVNISWAPWNSGRTIDWGGKRARGLFGYLIHLWALPCGRMPTNGHIMMWPTNTRRKQDRNMQWKYR